MTTSASMRLPSLRIRWPIAWARPCSAASRVRSWPASRSMSERRISSSTLRPTASSSVNPKRVVAAGFQPDTSSSRSIVTIATGLASTSDSKYVFCRSSSAVRSWTRRSSVATFDRSSAVISSNATARVPTSSSDWIPDTASRSPAGHLRGRRRERQDRARDAPRDEPDAAGQQDRGGEADDADDDCQLPCRPERLVLAELGHEPGAAVVEPVVDADDRDTAIVDVEAFAALACADLADPLRVDHGRLDPARERPFDEPAVAVDEVGAT